MGTAANDTKVLRRQEGVNGRGAERYGGRDGGTDRVGRRERREGGGNGQ